MFMHAYVYGYAYIYRRAPEDELAKEMTHDLEIRSNQRDPNPKDKFLRIKELHTYNIVRSTSAESFSYE